MTRTTFGESTRRIGDRIERGLSPAGGVAEQLYKAAEVSPERQYATYADRSISFGEIVRDADTLASHLVSLGISAGERVAVMMRNSPAMVKTVFALARANIAWVPVNARQQGSSLRYVLEHSKPSAIVCDSDLAATIAECQVDLKSAPIIVTERFLNAQSSLDTIWAAPKKFGGPFADPSDVFAVMYTSGTTGPPKGVVVSNSMMSYAAEAAIHVADIRNGDALFVWEPLYHIGGAQLLLLPTTLNVTLHLANRFSASNFWSEVVSTGATHVHYLGGILQILLKQPSKDFERDHRVRVFWGGGSTADSWRAFEKRFGVSIRECYGMTEASSITTANIDGIVGSVGRPVPWFEVEIVDANGRAVPIGHRGEIVIRDLSGHALFSGYFEDRNATETSLTSGTLHTGDLGSLDEDGNLYFHGRMGDSVRCKGENVSAWDVEHVAALHPLVEECAMIGVAAEVGEQDIKLFVKIKPGHRLEREEFAEWLRNRLASYQVPRYLAVVSSFKRTPSERIMKHLLPTTPEDDWR